MPRTIRCPFRAADALMPLAPQECCYRPKPAHTRAAAKKKTELSLVPRWPPNSMSFPHRTDPSRRPANPPRCARFPSVRIPSAYHFIRDTIVTKNGHSQTLYSRVGRQSRGRTSSPRSPDVGSMPTYRQGIDQGVRRLKLGLSPLSPEGPRTSRLYKRHRL